MAGRGLAWLGTTLLAACATSPSGHSHDGGGVAIDGATANPDPGRGIVRGTVWAPGLAPGLVPVGDEIPVSGATVVLSRDRLDGIPQRVYCDRCMVWPGQVAASRYDGSFVLDDVEPGRYWLTIQKGQFRREQVVAVEDGKTLELSALESALPSRSDPAAGFWIPRIAIALGGLDHPEDLLAKMGFGTSNMGQTLESAISEDGEQELDLFDNGTFRRRYAAVGTGNDLFSDPTLMGRYHVIIVPSTETLLMESLRTPAGLENVRRYVNDGGKLYVTHVAAPVIEYPFPPQLQLGDDGADSTGVYDPATLAGEPSTWGSGDGNHYNVEDGEVTDHDLATWLAAQTGPDPMKPVSRYDVNNLRIPNNGNWIEAINDMQLSTDGSGHPIVDRPKSWLIGSRVGTGDARKYPLAVTFEPTGCGRVMYSTYHVSYGFHPGVYSAERILLYLLLEIGLCSTYPPVE